MSETVPTNSAFISSPVFPACGQTRRYEGARLHSLRKKAGISRIFNKAGPWSCRNCRERMRAFVIETSSHRVGCLFSQTLQPCRNRSKMHWALAAGEIFWIRALPHGLRVNKAPMLPGALMLPGAPLLPGQVHPIARSKRLSNLIIEHNSPMRPSPKYCRVPLWDARAQTTPALPVSRHENCPLPQSLYQATISLGP